MAIIDMIGASEGGPYAINMTLPGQDGRDRRLHGHAQHGAVRRPHLGAHPAGTGRSGVLAVAGPCPAGTTRTLTRRRPRSGRSAGSGTRCRATTPRSTPTARCTCSAAVPSASTREARRSIRKRWRWRRAPTGVADCNAVGVPDERYGEAVTLVAARSPGQPPVSEADVIAAVRARLAAYKAPAAWSSSTRSVVARRQGGLPVGAQVATGVG